MAAKKKPPPAKKKRATPKYKPAPKGVKGNNQGRKGADRKPLAAVVADRAARRQLAELVKKVGRPSEYMPEFADLIIEHATSGRSLVHFAGTIRVAVATLYVWGKKHPEFLEAMAIAQTIQSGALEDECAGIKNAPAMQFRMRLLGNLHPAIFRDNSQVDHRMGGLPGSPPIVSGSIATGASPEQFYQWVMNGGVPPDWSKKEGEE